MDRNDGPPTERQIAYIEILLGARNDGYHSAAFQAIERIREVDKQDATSEDAGRTINALMRSTASSGA